MHRWSISSFFLFAIISAKAVPAHEIDAALARLERRQVSLSTGVSLDSVVPTTTSDILSTTTIIDSSTVTSQGSTVIESSTVTAPPSVTSQTTVVSSTITRTSTDANGQTTQVPETIASTATSQYTYSYSQYITSSASQVVETYTSIEGGSTVIGTRTSSTLVPVTTSARVTPTALAANGEGGSSGLSDSSKKIIGGVVGGVGGALLIGALAYTAWRIWGKKKNLHDDDLYDPNANAEKMSLSTDNNSSAFHSTLDQYHRPGPVNTASNF